MRLHDLTPGQRFSFRDKHRGKVFEVTATRPHAIQYTDVATNELRVAWSNREMFRKEVRIVTPNRVVELTPSDLHTFNRMVTLAMQLSSELEEPESERTAMDKLFTKVNGTPGRRVVLPK